MAAFAHGRRRGWRWALLALLVLIAPATHADIFRPAYLELREVGGDAYDVLWKVPAQDPSTPLALRVVLPEGARPVGDKRAVYTAGTLSERWRIHHPGGLVGQTLRVSGQAAGVTDVIVRVERQDGTSQVERLGAGRDEVVVAAPEGVGRIAWSYLVLGFEHILAGIDHLLFVLALLLIVRGARRIVATVTAFTVAHSITQVARARAPTRAWPPPG